MLDVVEGERGAWRIVEEHTLLTPITLLPACAALAAACEDILSSYRATSAQLTRWWIGCARCGRLRVQGRQSSVVGSHESWAELFPDELPAKVHNLQSSLQIRRIKIDFDNCLMVSDRF
jgi:hypothetical protein